MTKTNFSEAKAALLQKWVRGEVNDDTTTIPRRSSSGPPALSFPQQRQLFLEMLQPGTSVNNLSTLLSLKGKIDKAALEQSANEIIKRHDALRTCFLFNKTLPAVKVLADIEITIPVIDLQHIKKSEQEIKSKQLAEKEVLQPFNLMQPPLIRLKLYALSEEEYCLLVIVHHTIADGWSLGVFIKELTQFYQNITAGVALQLPRLPVRYADFAAWQTDTRRVDSMQSSLNYWKQQLSGVLPVLELPTDFPRSTKQTFEGSTHHFLLSKNVTFQLEKFCKEQDATLYMTLLSVLGVLLYRYSGQDDILVGSPVANRNLPEIENLIGVFINTIVLRLKIEEDITFNALVNKVKNISLEAYANQDLPFEKLVEELKPKRDLSRTPIFQVVFNLQNAPMPNIEMSGLKIRTLEIDRGVSEFDLTLMVTKSGDEYNCTVEYNTNLFSLETISRMFDSFQLLLGHALAEPDYTVSKFKLVDDDYMHHIIYELNQTQSNFPRDKCLHQLFEEQVQKTPNAIALIYKKQSLTYLGLNNCANRLARHLQSLGVKTGTRVGVLMEKTLEITQALLGIMKTGGTYIPIRTSYPAERIKSILNDANVEVLLTNIATEILGNLLISVVDLNDDTYLMIDDCSNLHTNITADNLAYIIYTSGSTGKSAAVDLSASGLLAEIGRRYALL